MRWFLFFLVVCALLWWFRGVEEVRPPTVEESLIIGKPVKALRKGEGVEKSYLEATEERKKRMEQQLEEDSGG